MFNGVGWPNGAVDNATILALPGPLLMLSSEHWHVQEATDAGKRVIYRAMALEGHRPAEVGWSASKYMTEIMRDVKQSSLATVITDFIPANELDLNYERGDGEDDFSDLGNRYNTIATFLYKLEPLLRKALPNAKLHWPAFTPNKDHSAIDYINTWKYAADKYDYIDFHAYVNLQNIQNEYILYGGSFDPSILMLTEWHCKGDIDEEQRVLEWLRDTDLPAFFFIYEWHNAPGWWSTDYDIAHNADRYDMFASSEVDESPPTVVVPTTAELKAHAQQRLSPHNFDWPTYEKQLQQESGWKHYDGSGNVLTSYTGVAKGVGQLNKNFYSEDVWSDPWKNLDASIDTMITYLQRYGTYRKALAAYNWGPGNVGGYTSAGNIHPAWDGTREWRCPVNLPQCNVTQMHHYLDVILGSGWPEPESIPMPSTYAVGPGVLQLMHDNDDEPASDELYFKNDKGVNQYSVTKGKSGASYEYTFSTNETHRFPPD